MTPEGNMRIGSSGNMRQRLRVHKRRGWTAIILYMCGMGDPTKRFGTERSLSRFYAAQAKEEEFEVVNTDF